MRGPYAHEDDIPEGVECLDMDGMQHPTPGRERCHCGLQAHGVTCPYCGGFAHYQPVWGGYYRQCEVCRKTWT